MPKTFRSTCLLLLLASPLAAPAFAETRFANSDSAFTQPVEAADTQDDPLYAKGTKAMNEQRWADAINAFDLVVAAKGKRVDAALYWKAYSLDKLGRKDEMRAVCSGLADQFPKSTWNKECFALRSHSLVDTEALRELTRESANRSRELAHLDLYRAGDSSYTTWNYDNGKKITTEDDIRILALNSLMRTDSAKAMPMLRDLLRSDKPIAVRKQALFVLSRSKQPEAQALLTEVANNKSSPELQRAAIEIIGVGRGKESGPLLADIYRTSTDAGVKRAAVNGLFIAHDAPHLVELARGEKDLNLKRDIVSQLALMHDQVATDYMLELLK